MSLQVAELLGGLHQLGEHPARGFRVDERHQVAHHAFTRLLVEQPRPVSAQLVQRSADVVDPVGQVVHALATLLQEAADRRLRPGGRDELDMRTAKVEHGGVNAVLLHALAHARGDSEELLVTGDAGIEIGDGYSYVVDLLVCQASAFSSWSRCCSRCATSGRRTRYSTVSSPCSIFTVRCSSSGVTSARNLSVR